MGTWVLVVVLATGKTIGSFFSSEAECKKHLSDVQAVMHDSTNVIVDAQCSEGDVKPESDQKTPAETNL